MRGAFSRIHKVYSDLVAVLTLEMVAFADHTFVPKVFLFDL